MGTVLTQMRVNDREKVALKKATKKGLSRAVTKVYFQADRVLLESRGWVMVSHTPSSYGAPESYVMEIDASHLRARAA